MATIADHFAPAERGAPISILISASNSAFVIALPVIAALAAIGGWQLPFIVVEVYLAGVWVWHWYGFPVRSAGARQTLGFAAHFKAAAQIRTLWCVLLANILFRAASFAVFTYFVAFLVQSYGLTQSETHSHVTTNTQRMDDARLRRAGHGRFRPGAALASEVA